MRFIWITKRRYYILINHVPAFKWGNFIKRAIFIYFKLQAKTSVSVCIVGKHKDHITTFGG